MSDRVPYLASRLQGFGTTIFAEMSALAVATGSINLGQGFPDTDGPPEVLRGRDRRDPRRATTSTRRGPASADLRRAIAEHQQQSGTASHFDPDTEVLVTAGATEAIAAALLALCEPGDEVVTFEPYYDSYAACIAMAGARIGASSRCAPPDYAFDLDALRAAITPRTRLILLNSPHNPTGKVFVARRARGDRRAVRRARPHRGHRRGVRAPRLRRRARPARHAARHARPHRHDLLRRQDVLVHRAGRSAGSCAPPPLVAAVRTAKQFLTYVNGAPFQPAIAVGLRLPDDVLRRARGRAARASATCLSAGLAERRASTVYPPAGTYFVTADIRPLGEHDGVAFCRCAARAVRRGRGPERGVLRRRATQGRRSCGSRSASARGARRGRRSAEGRSGQAGRQREGRRDPARHRVGGPAARTSRASRRLISEAAAQGARLVVLTEMYATGFSMAAERIAEPAGGPSDAVPRRAGRTDTASGSAARCPRCATGRDAPVNCLVLAGPDGTVHRYAKIHPFSYAGEHEHYDAGDELVTVDVDGVRRQPLRLLRPALRRRVLGRSRPTPTATSSSRTGRRRAAHHWRTLLRARAIENQAYVVGVNRVGDGRRRSTTPATAPSSARWARSSSVGAVARRCSSHDVDPAVVADARARSRSSPTAAEPRSIRSRPRQEGDVMDSFNGKVAVVTGAARAWGPSSSCSWRPKDAPSRRVMSTPRRSRRRRSEPRNEAPPGARVTTHLCDVADEARSTASVMTS